MKIFFEYSKKLLWNIYGFINFVLTIFTVLSFIGYRLLFPTWLWTLFLVLSLYLGGFLVYFDLQSERPKTAKLEFEYVGRKSGIKSWHGSFPISPLRIQLGVNIANRGEEKGKVTKINLTKHKFGNNEFDPSIRSRNVYILPRDSRRISAVLPLEVPGRDSVSVEYEIQLDYEKMAPLNFAKVFRNISNFSANLFFEYEDMDGKKFFEDKKIVDNYDDLKKEVKRIWEERGESELAFEISRRSKE